MRVLLVGNYGAGNLGDESLKEYFLDTYPDVEWVVTSAHPQAGEYVHLPRGIHSLFTPWWRTVAAIRKTDAIVFGGGSLFTDTESIMACGMWWWYTMMLRLFRKPIHFAFQGVGPFRTRLGAALARSALRNASSISVRDSLSLARVQEWKLNTEVVLTFDPIFKLIAGKKHDVSTKNVLVIIPRMNSGEALLSKAKVLVEREQWEDVRIVSLQPEHAGERRACRALKKCAPRAVLVQVQILTELVDALQDAALVLAERYHGALAALALEKECEVVYQRPGDKLSALGQLSQQKVQREELLRLVRAGEEELRRALGMG